MTPFEVKCDGFPIGEIPPGGGNVVYHFSPVDEGTGADPGVMHVICPGGDNTPLLTINYPPGHKQGEILLPEVGQSGSIVLLENVGSLSNSPITVSHTVEVTRVAGNVTSG
jgi:hypothetical protein